MESGGAVGGSAAISHRRDGVDGHDGAGLGGQATPGTIPPNDVRHVSNRSSRRGGYPWWGAEGRMVGCSRVRRNGSDVLWRPVRLHAYGELGTHVDGAAPAFTVDASWRIRRIVFSVGGRLLVLHP